MKYTPHIILVIAFLIPISTLFLHKDILPTQSFSGGNITPVLQPKLGAAGPQEIYSSDYKNQRPEYVKYPIEADGKSNLNIPTYTSGTTTDYMTIPARKVVRFDTEFLAQGLCIVVKNSNGNGFSYLSVQDGILSVSINSCE